MGGVTHLLLEYALADDYLDRRAALRDDHLRLVREAHARGELLLAGAVPDPYVVHGLVTSWTVREWNVVVGGAEEPTHVRSPLGWPS